MLTTYLTELHIKTLKSDLTHCSRATKIVGSGHLTEALAFSVGFNTHAALRAALQGAEGGLCVEFCEERFWSRLSELSGFAIPKLCDALSIDLSGRLSQATKIRDMRAIVTVPSDLKEHWDEFFTLMADHGANYFVVEAHRAAKPVMGFSGFYRPSNMQQAMRTPFLSPVPSLWGVDSCSAQLVDDFLAEHVRGPDRTMDWASDAHQLMEPDLNLGDVLFDAAIGIVVRHDEIDGCERSIVYQRAGQLGAVRAADALQARMRLAS